ELDLDARQVTHLHALVLAHGMSAELRRRRARDLPDERLPFGVEDRLRREARHSDGAVHDRGGDDVGQRMIGGLARDRIPWILADPDQVIVGTFFGKYTNFFYFREVLDP